MRWHTHERERRRSTSRTGPHLRRIPARTAGHPRLSPRAANNTGNGRREYASSLRPPPAASRGRKFSPVFMFTPLITPLYPSFLSLPLALSSPRHLPPRVYSLVCPAHPAFLDFPRRSFFHATHPISRASSFAPAFASAFISGNERYRTSLSRDCICNNCLAHCVGMCKRAYNVCTRDDNCVI